MPVTMNLTLTLDGVTYGELYEFVDAARAAGVPDDEPVRCVGSDDRGDRFELDLSPGRRRTGSAPAATGALTGRSDGPGAPAPGGATAGGTAAGSQVPPNLAAIADTVRSMVRNGEDLDRVIAALGDLRKFFR